MTVGWWGEKEGESASSDAGINEMDIHMEVNICQFFLYLCIPWLDIALQIPTRM